MSPCCNPVTPQHPGLPFIANEGRVDHPDVAFYSHDHYGDTFITKGGEITYRLLPNGGEQGWVLKEWLAGGEPSAVQGLDSQNTPKIHFLSAPSIAGMDHSTGISQGRFGNRSASVFSTLYWKQVYNGIDLALQRRQGSFEKIHTLQPGADPDLIRWEMAGLKALSVDSAGELVVDTELGQVRFSRPVAYQVIDGQRQPVRVGYKVAGHSYGFDTGSYRKDLPLTIDPLLASTYLGTGDRDGDVAKPQIVHDASSGEVIVAGVTLGVDFPTVPGAFDITHNGNARYDIFIARLSDDLSTLIAAGFIGGTANDSLRGMQIDASGRIVIAGDTVSSDFPTTTGSYQTERAEYNDAFVSIISSDLSTLLASTYFGDTGQECAGSGSEYVASLAIDGQGNILIAGNSSSRTLPVSANAYQATISTGRNGFPCGHDAYIAKFDSSLNTVLAATYYGQGGADNLSESVVGMTIDGNDNVTIAGWAVHDLLPVTVAEGAYGGGQNDTYVARFNSDLSVLQHAGYLGGSGQDTARALAGDAAGNVYIGGNTTSDDFPVFSGSWQSTPLTAGFSAGRYGTLAILDSTLQLTSSTYLQQALPYAVHIDSSHPTGKIVVAGSSSNDFPYPANAYNPLTDHLAPQGVLIARFDSALDSLVAGTSLQGQCYLNCDVTTDAAGNVYVIGSAIAPGGRNTIDLTQNAFDPDFNGGSQDLFISKLSPQLDGVPELRVSPESHDFGTIDVPNTQLLDDLAIEFRLSNKGNGWLSILSSELTGENPEMFRVESSTCIGTDANLRPEQILPAENYDCVAGVAFRPFTIESREWRAQLKITSTDPAATVTTIPLIGRTRLSTDHVDIEPLLNENPNQQELVVNGSVTSASSGGGGSLSLFLLSFLFWLFGFKKITSKQLDLFIVLWRNRLSNIS